MLCYTLKNIVKTKLKSSLTLLVNEDSSGLTLYQMITSWSCFKMFSKYVRNKHEYFHTLCNGNM